MWGTLGRGKLSQAARAVGWILILAATAGFAQQEPPNLSRRPLIPPEETPGTRSAPLTAKQKQAMLKDNFETMKRQADTLATLAKALQDDLSKSNADVLSLQVISKAEQIEKLAKKIKSRATTSY